MKKNKTSIKNRSSYLSKILLLAELVGFTCFTVRELECQRLSAKLGLKSVASVASPSLSSVQNSIFRIMRCNDVLVQVIYRSWLVRFMGGTDRSLCGCWLDERGLTSLNNSNKTKQKLILLLVAFGSQPSVSMF